MKIRIFSLILSLMFAFTTQAQSYETLWKSIEQMEKKDLPKSVLAKAEMIFAKAKTERNVSQMMKAYLTMMAWRGNISPDSIAMDIEELEVWAAEPDIAIQDKAVLRSILGGLFIRKDFEKGNRYLQLSLKDSLKLVDYPAEKLVPMVKSGETSRLYFDNNLYDLLARRAIRLWEENLWNTQQEDIRKTIQAAYQSLLHIYKEKGMRSAWLLTALDAYPQADEKQLRKWITEYGDLDVCAEVYLRLARRMMNDGKPSERLALLREGIRRYPRYNRINALKNEEREILSPKLHLSANEIDPESPVPVVVEYRNLSGITFKLYRVNLSVESTLLTKVNENNIAKYGTLIRQKHFDLPETPDYQMRKDTINLENLDAGIYYALATPDGRREAERGVLMYVTGLQVIHRSLPDDKHEVVVLNKRSGHPVPGAQVNIYRNNEDGYVWQESHTTNADGVVMLTKGNERYIYFQAWTDKDKAMPITRIWLGSNRYRVVEKTERHISLFTDRGIYRPGQTLRYSGIAYSQRRDEVYTDGDMKHDIVLLDADGKEVARQEVRSDTFGSFSGSFELPKMGKMGYWHLQSDGEMVAFRVEEYKRPTFEVTFDTVRTSYRVGDSIRVTGVARTFAGAPVQGAVVKYQVSRLENTYWRMRGAETNRVTGETTTDAEGRFEVPVYFWPIEEGVRSWYYTYEVSADVTNLAGETQDGSLSLPLGSSSLRLFIPDWEGAVIIKEQIKEVTFRVSNLVDVPMKVEVDYQLLSKDKPVLQGKAVSNEALILKGMDALPSGCYQLKAKVKDRQGKEIEQTVSFSLFSLNDKRLPEDMGIWCYQPNEEFGADGTATIYFGSGEKDVYLFYDVMYGENRMERKHIVFSDSLMTFRYTYREEYGDGLRCSFAYLKNGELYVKDLVIKKPKPDKALQLKWKTFRDKLQPGTKETWTLSILHSDGKPADAQLLAAMYDASLDQLVPHTWRFGLNFVRRFPNAYWLRVNVPHPYWTFTFPLKLLDVNSLIYSRLDLPDGLSVEQQGLRMYKASAALGSVRNTNGMLYESADDFALEETATEYVTLESTDNVQLRTNFAETAFFYPNLRTDANGEVTIEFTLPESLTEWKFMGLAHTKEMDYGNLTDKVMATKDFMLQPNLPRFVRVGDQVNVAASLINLSSKEVKGTARMELFLPETEKLILTQKRPFVVKAGETGKVSFDFHVTDKYERLAVRMVADGGAFSDGEQRYLPVLSNKQKLTESILLNANGKGAFAYSLETLFNQHSKTVTRPQMWVEYTGNPMWYAVQALKVVSNPEADNALSWASGYYANALLAHMVKTEPRIADSIKVDELEVRLAEAVLKLKDLQLEDGSWSWYKGMSGSVYMTTAITQLLARLQQMTGAPLQGDVMQMYRNAAAYLYKQVEAEVQQIDEFLKQGNISILPSETTLQYLYIHALDKDVPMQQRIQLKLMTLIKEHPSAFTIYGKALSAIIFKEAGKKAEAKHFLESLMQYSVMTEEMGRYFDTPKAEYSWFSYKIPTQVAAIEAIKRVTNEEKTLVEMKQWLLKQKQAQVWDTPIATTDAVYALLTTGEGGLASVGESEIQIRAGEIMIREGDSENCEGENKNREGDFLEYISQQIQGDVMKLRQVKVERESAGIGWGAVYAEFEEDMDKVTAQGNALKVVRILYQDGKPLVGGEVLQVGDKLTVRLTVMADRDMDFVQVKDERAACLEPADALSGYRWNGQVGYYQETKDASTSFYFDRMRKGTYELTYDVYVTSSGMYQQGIATARSMYAPEFGGHGKSSRLMVK